MAWEIDLPLMLARRTMQNFTWQKSFILRIPVGEVMDMVIYIRVCATYTTQPTTTLFILACTFICTENKFNVVLFIRGRNLLFVMTSLVMEMSLFL